MIGLLSHYCDPLDQKSERVYGGTHLDDDLQSGNSESTDADEEYQLWEAMKRESEHGDTQMLIAVSLRSHSLSRTLLSTIKLIEHVDNKPFMKRNFNLRNQQSPGKIRENK